MKYPVKICKAFCRLIIIRKQKVVSQGDGEPDQVRAEEEEVAGDQLDPPARGRHCRGLGGHAGSLVLRQADALNT